MTVVSSVWNGVSGGFRAVGRAIAAIAVAIENRRAVRSLAQYDDAMLRDIGLTRSDVYAALDQPLLRDPTAHLVELNSARRLRQAGGAAGETGIRGLHKRLMATLGAAPAQQAAEISPRATAPRAPAPARNNGGTLPHAA